MNKRWRLVLAAAAALLIGGGGLAFLVWLNHETSPEAMEERAFKIQTDDPTPEQIERAIEFSHVELTGGAEVRRLALRTDRLLGYHLLVAVTPGTEEELFLPSEFTVTFDPVDPESAEQYTVHGVEVPTGPDVALAESDVRDDNGWILVGRDILVDRTDPNETILHIQASAP